MCGGGWSVRTAAAPRRRARPPSRRCHRACRRIGRESASSCFASSCPVPREVAVAFPHDEAEVMTLRPAECRQGHGTMRVEGLGCRSVRPDREKADDRQPSGARRLRLRREAARHAGGGSGEQCDDFPSPSFDHLVGAGQEQRRDVETDGFGGLQVGCPSPVRMRPPRL
jgi:hypothetical protein